MKYSLIITLLLTTAISSTAQKYISFGMTALNYNFDKFNAEIDESFPTLENAVVDFKLGVHYKFDSGSQGFYISYMGGFSEPSTTFGKTKFSGYSISSDIQYNIFKCKNFAFGPNLEVGLRKYYMQLGGSAAGVKIKDVIAEPLEDIEFSSFGTFLDLGLKFSQYFPVYVYDMGVGLSVGYRIDDIKWKHNGLSTINDEITKGRGWYAGLLFHLRFKDDAVATL